ncbi:hypothetical protein [Oceanobacillus sp. FSL H7-0719]|uniref:hypothetical protein n=1 Tax=Oceanobacillus sp. FSL H7-0719 TaxID=2954507 RepID=UPI0032535EDC
MRAAKIMFVILFSVLFVLTSGVSIFASQGQENTARTDMVDSQGNLIKFEDYKKDIKQNLENRKGVFQTTINYKEIPKIDLGKSAKQKELLYEVDEDLNIVDK